MWMVWWPVLKDQPIDSRVWFATGFWINVYKADAIAATPDETGQIR